MHCALFVKGCIGTHKILEAEKRANWTEMGDVSKR